MLTQQGYTPDDILPEGKKVNLRRNSNISTGGDSIDVTETMDSSYQELAAAIAWGPGLVGLTSLFQMKPNLLAKKTLIAPASSSTLTLLCICTPTVLKDLDRLSLQKS